MAKRVSREVVQNVVRSDPPKPVATGGCGPVTAAASCAAATSSSFSLETEMDPRSGTA